MISDKEKLMQLLTEFGIRFKEEVEEGNSNIHLIEIGTDFWNGKDYIHQKTVDGYVGFYARFSFDKKGKFLILGLWE